MTRCDTFVFFGASGDLAFKKVFPALYRIVASGHLTVPVIGVANSPWDTKRLVERARRSVEKAEPEFDRSTFDALASLLTYIRGDYTEPATFSRLCEQLGKAQRPLYYMAIPPLLFDAVVRGLHESGCARGGRLVVEKPFARDLESAKELNRVILNAFPEESVYRIDHFLGKEAVENLSYFRFANSVFEPIWGRHYVDSVQITMAESFGVRGRGAFYEEAGAIRDVLQNHLLQVVATLTMESPPRGEATRQARARQIQAIRALRPSEVVRGQYRGYRDEPGVASDSDVETYCAVKLFIDDDRWAGVPFFIRAGKRLPVSITEARVIFKRPPRPALGDVVPEGATYLRYRLGPEVSIALGLRTKHPGTAMTGQPAELVAHSDPRLEMPAYERLLCDALSGRNDLFASQQSVEAEWHVVDDVLAAPPPLHLYEPGTWGPEKGADRLIAGAGPWYAPRECDSAE